VTPLVTSNSEIINDVTPFDRITSSKIPINVENKTTKAHMFNRLSQESFVAEIQAILSEIRRLKRKIVSIDSIIDTVIIREFSFDYGHYHPIEA
jgi:hypothetical protein